MSDSPIVFKRTKSKPGSRARTLATDDAASETTGTEGAEQSPSETIARVKKLQKARAKPKARVSFGGDDEEGEGEVFQVKKSSLSRKLALGKNVVSPGFDPTSPRANNGGPTYDANYLSELKASTPTARPSQPVYDVSYDADASMNDVTMGDISMDPMDVTEAEIPTTSFIAAAKQKRDTARKTGGITEDFISLSVTKRTDQGPHPESRLVREEDELGEADDEFAEYTSAQERIALGKKGKKAEAKKKKELMQVAIEEIGEDDEEEMEWEQEQLRRGGHQGQTPETTTPVKAVYKPAPIPPITPIPTLDPAVARLTQALTILTTSHAQNTSLMTSLAEEQLQLEEKEKELRQMVEKTEAKRSWFVAFREWVEGVASFLDEKYPQLERFEEEHVSLLKERSDMISTRRAKDDEDDLSRFFGELPQQPDQQPSASARQQRSVTRIQRRLNRRRSNSTPQSLEDGFSTDASLASSETQDFELALEKLQEKVGNVLSDVRAEGFRDPKAGLAKWFGEWRDQYEEIYVGAWGGLGLVGAWEFWGRLEILGWNPFQEKRTLDTFKWYEGLYQYSTISAAGEDGEMFGPEGDLASAMISTAIVPRLCQIIERGAFDPYSAKDIRTMTDLAEQIEIAVRDTANLKFQLLLKSVHTMFQRAFDAEKALLEPYISVNRPKFDPEAIPARKRYLNRRIKLVEGIVRWRKYSGAKFGAQELVRRIVDEIMLPVAEGGWEVGGEQCLRKLVQVLPKDLATPGLTSRLGRV